MITVKKYSAGDNELWNDFLASARTDCFMFSRNFMEYHSDRFTDHSMLVFENDILVGICPANIKNSIIYSHGGLTFGGLIISKNTYSVNTLKYFSAILKFLSVNNIEKLFLKQPPVFYNTVSADELDYAMFIADAKLIRVDIAYAINLQLKEKLVYQERRSRAIKKALKSGIEIKETTDFTAFWNEILTPNLQSRFGVSPVHSLQEMQQLYKQNPGCIRQFEAIDNGKLMAGTTIFETPLVAHAQYISASEEGRKNGAIDLLFHQLISETFAYKNTFDFGIINEVEGRQVNIGLLEWKEGFGAKAYAHRFYEVDTRNYASIEKLFTPD